MKRKEIIEECSRLLGALGSRIELENSQDLRSLNISVEDLYKEMFNILFDWHLANENILKRNNIAVDLASKKDLVAVQVTVTTSAEKIHDTLKSFGRSDYGERYSRLLVAYPISKRPKHTADFTRYSPPGLNFDSEKDIFSFSEVLAFLKSVPLEKQVRFHQLLNKELAPLERGHRTISKPKKKMVFVVTVFLTAIFGVMVKIFLSGEAAITGQERIEKKIDRNADLLNPDYGEEAEQLVWKLQRRINIRADEEKESLSKDDPDWPSKIIEIDKHRDFLINQSFILIDFIVDGLEDEGNEVFRQAVEILEHNDVGGIEKAMEYLKMRLPLTLKSFQIQKKEIETNEAVLERRREKNFRSLEYTYGFLASLKEINFEWEEALQLRELVAQEAPKHFRAQSQLGVSLYNLRRFKDARNHLQLALNLAKTTEEQILSVRNFAYLLRELGERESGGAMMVKAVKLAERSFGPTHIAVAKALNGLGIWLFEGGEYHKAEQVFYRSLRISDSNPTSGSLVVEPIANLGQILSLSGYSQEAEIFSREGLVKSIEKYKLFSKEVATSLNNYAQILRNDQRLEEAVMLQRWALLMTHRVYGWHHPLVLTMLSNLGELMEECGRLNGAVGLYLLAVELDRRGLGMDSSDSVSRSRLFANLLRRMGDYRTAESILISSLEDQESKSVNGSSQIPSLLGSLSKNLFSEGRLFEAEVVLKRAILIDESNEERVVFPEATSRFSMLATIFRLTNRMPMAEILFFRALVVARNEVGDEDPRLAPFLNNFATVLVDTGQFALAETFFRHAIRLEEGQSGGRTEQLASFLVNYSEVLRKAKNFSDAKICLEHAIAIYLDFEKKNKKAHPDYDFTVASYGSLLVEKGETKDLLSQRIERLSKKFEKQETGIFHIKFKDPLTVSIDSAIIELKKVYQRKGGVFSLVTNHKSALGLSFSGAKGHTAFTWAAMAYKAKKSGYFSFSILLNDHCLNHPGIDPILRSVVRMNKAAALYEVNRLKLSLKELQELMQDLLTEPSLATKGTIGRLYYHIGFCQRLLGRNLDALEAANKSLELFRDPQCRDADPVFIENTLDLINLLDTKQPVDLSVLSSRESLEEAKFRLQSLIDLSILPVGHKNTSLIKDAIGAKDSLDQMLSLLRSSWGRTDLVEIPIDQKEPLDNRIEKLTGSSRGLPSSKLKLVSELGAIFGEGRSFKDGLNLMRERYEGFNKNDKRLFDLSSPCHPYLAEILHAK